MKKFIVKLSCYIVVIFLQACYSSDSNLSTEMQIEQYYKNSLHLDKKFISYILEIDKLSQIQTKPDVDLMQLNKLIGTIENLNDVESILNPYFNEPSKFLTIVNEFYLRANEFRMSNSDFFLLPDYSQQKLIEFAIPKVMDNFKGINSKKRIDGKCEDQKDSSRQTCRDASWVAAAGCGLLSPTILLALGCGVVVIGGLEVCYADADRTYQICRSGYSESI